MLKKKLFGILPLILGLMLVFTLIGCKDDGPGGIYGGNDMGEGWPSSSKLNQFGLNGMSQPTGATNITWVDYTDLPYTGYNYPIIYIGFSGTAATSTAIYNWFNTNGWTPDTSDYFDPTTGTAVCTYTKGSYEAYFCFGSGTGWIISGAPLY